MPLAFCIFHKEQNHMVKRILQYFRRETVLSAALICALVFPADPAVGHTLAGH